MSLWRVGWQPSSIPTLACVSTSLTQGCTLILQGGCRGHVGRLRSFCMLAFLPRIYFPMNLLVHARTHAQTWAWTPEITPTFSCTGRGIRMELPRSATPNLNCRHQKCANCESRGIEKSTHLCTTAEQSWPADTTACRQAAAVGRESSKSRQMEARTRCAGGNAVPRQICCSFAAADPVRTTHGVNVASLVLACQALVIVQAVAAREGESWC